MNCIMATEKAEGAAPPTCYSMSAETEGGKTYTIITDVGENETFGQASEAVAWAEWEAVGTVTEIIVNPIKGD